jgi:lipid-binding SYLF domain-containing protein
MKRHGSRFAVSALVAVFVAVLVAVPSRAFAQSDAQLAANAKTSLGYLESSTPLAKSLGPRAYAVLVFPDITKAGFLIGGEYGNGVLFRGGKVAGYYNTAGVSYGLQAGAQTFGYAMFFMNESAFQALNAKEGLQVGVGPSVVVMDQGMARSYTSETLTKDAYAFIYGQQGLMAGMGLEGTKITRLKR